MSDKMKTLRLPQVAHGTATQLPYPDDYFDAVLTDPPYYDNVPYSDLSDFFYCLTPSTLVVTDHGYMPIEQIRAGMNVLSHKGRWTRVNAVSKRYYCGAIFSVHIAYCSTPLEITPGHNILVRKKGATQGEWIPPEELQKGDFMFIPTYRSGSKVERIRLRDHLSTHYPADDEWLYYGRVSDETLAIHRELTRVHGAVSYGDLQRLSDALGAHPNKVRRLRHEGPPMRLRVRDAIAVDHHFAALVGYYLAEGSITLRDSGRHVLSFVFHEAEQEYVREVEDLMNKLFAVTGKRQNRPTEKAIALTFHRAPVAEFLAENFGKDSASKKLPPWFLDLPDDVLSAFVKRFWTGDGSTGHEFYQLTTVSAMLAGQIRLILQRLGVAVHVYQDGERTTAWGPKTVRSRPRFLLKAFGKQRRALAKILGMKVNSEQEGIHLVQLEKEGLWVPVRRIEVKEYDGLVYNLSTDDHSYTTIQGCVHNCWLKRTVGDLYPDLFATPLSPKSDEMVADASKAGGMEQAKRRFEEMLTQSFREIRRVLRPDGIAVVVFAHKTTEAWETVIGALLSAGLYLTASWPVHTEMQARLRAQESAALASSIYMVCRKRPFRPDGRPSVGEYAAVQREMEARIREKLAQFWAEGIRGADFFMSAIGPAVEAFGRYDRVERLSGDPVTVAELLDDVRRMVGEFALERILTLTPPPPPAAAPPPLSRQAGEGRGPGGEVRAVDPLTRFYLLWRWTYNHARVPFDDARKLAAIVGVELTEHWGPGGLVEKQKEYVHVRAPHERARDPRFVARMEGQSAAPSRPTMVDALHWAAVLWAENRIAELQDYLAATYGENEAFWQVVQAVGDVLPEGDRERQLLQGLLYGRQHYTRGARQLRLG